LNVLTDSGIYIVCFRLPGRRRIQVGKLGRFVFEPGFYFYVGSAQKNLSARIDRHGRQRKPLRWHIDYLSTRAVMVGVITMPGPRSRECKVAKTLGAVFDLAIPRFGASDCKCPGHLFYTKRLA
jgi:sugar fermentation stimulation protein A